MAKPQEFYIGVDAGGTKTYALAIDASGISMGNGTSKAANYHNLGISQSFNHIFDAIHQVIDSVGYKPTERIRCNGVVIGMAGLDTPRDREQIIKTLEINYLVKIFAFANKLMIVPDTLVGLYSGCSNSEGICIISGTGSNVYGITKDGSEANAGDWGYLLGDQGSGYAIGQGLLKLFMQEYDGRLPKSILTDKVIDLLQLNHPLDIVNWLYNQPNKVERIAKIGKLAIDKDVILLPQVNQVVLDATNAITSAYKAVISKLNLNQNSEITVVLVGGVMMYNQLFREEVSKGIKSITPNIQITLPTKPPAEGAAIMMQSNFYGASAPKSVITFNK